MKTAVWRHGPDARLAHREVSLLKSVFSRGNLLFCVYIAAYALAYKCVRLFDPASGSPFWIPDTILLCALLLNRPRKWWAFLLATLPVRLFIGTWPHTPSWFPLVDFFIGCLKGVLSASALRLALNNPFRFVTIRDYALFCLYLVFLIPAVCAFAGATARYSLGGDYWRSWQKWFLGAAATHLVVTPAIFYGLLDDAARAWRGALERWKEAAFLAGGLALAGYIAFNTRPGASFSESSFYAPVPFLFWAAIRFGMFGASGAMVLIALFSIPAAFHARGHFFGQSPVTITLETQDFLISRAIPLYLVAVLIEQKKGIEESYRKVVESQTDLVCRFRPDTTLTFVNEAYCRFFGKRRSELIGGKFVDLLPEKTRQLAMDKVALVVSRREPSTWDHEVLRPGGGVGWHHWVNHPIFGPNGEIEECQAIGQDITDRKRAEELARLLSHAQEEERKRIARELHDDFNQRLAAHAISLSNLKKRMLRENAITGDVEKLQEEAIVLGEEIRLIAHALHPPSIEHNGLENALRSFCGEFSALTPLRVDFAFEGNSKQVPSNVALCCFRVVQEGLRNVVKHARANEAQVKAVATQDRLFLTLADDGIGVDGNTHIERGIGIDSMRERVELLSGDFRIANREPQGTIVMVSLPLSSGL